jgi:hypothetical protein
VIQPHTSFKQNDQARSGTAAIEFAVLCPLMLLLGLACADFGRITRDYQIVANAARSGAEYGAAKQFSNFTRLTWESRVHEVVISELANLPNFDEGKLSYNLSTSLDADDLPRIVIELGYPFATSVAWPGLPGETQLIKRVEFRQFR